MNTKKRFDKMPKLKDFVKKNPKLMALKKLPPEVIARAIKTKMNEEDDKK